jgi:hypothetical protein
LILAIASGRTGASLVRVSDADRSDRREPPATTGPIRHLSVYFEDPALWPLLLIFVVHVALAGALLMLAALRGGSLLAQAALAVLIVLGANGIRRAQRRRRVAIWLVSLWGLAALIALGGSHLGLL